MAAKTLIRSGASIATRFLNSAANSSPSSTQQTLFSPSSKLFLSHELSKSHPFQFFPHTRQNDAVLPSDVPFSSPLGRSKEVEEKTSEIAMNIFPFGHPSLDFFLPDASDSSDDPMILFPKRTFQPSTLRRKRVHGFFARKATKGGRRVIKRRIAKGRHRITA